MLLFYQQKPTKMINPQSFILLKHKTLLYFNIKMVRLLKLIVLLAIIGSCLTQVIQPCLSPCNVCITGSSLCKTCVYGYVLQGNYCVPTNCQVVYCSVCSNNNTCIQCNLNFILINNTCICRTNYGPNLIGSPSASCVCPAPGSSTNPASCSICTIDGCLTCSNSSNCATCASTYISNGMGGCISCNIANCNSCIVNNFCQTCANGMTVTANGQCAACNINTAGCTVCTNNNTCNCAQGYNTLNNGTNSSCLPCLIPNCITCSSANICSTCQSNYNPSFNGSSCIPNNFITTPCLLPCSQCFSNGSCLTCIYPFSNFTNSSGFCYYCYVANCDSCFPNNSYLCSSCSYGYTRQFNGTNCTLTVQNCINYNTTYNYCTSCSPYFAILNGRCYPCSNTGPSCTECQSPTSNVCFTCNQLTYQSNGNCIPCPYYCQTCNSSGCITFASNVISIGGIYYSFNCLTTCTSCSNINPAYCNQCISGYYLQNGICYPCLLSSNCQTCIVAQPNVCLSCRANMIMAVINGTTICQNCIYPCSSCLQSNISFCTACPVGKYLSNGTCLNNVCSQFCEVCSSPTTCLLCMPGYWPLNSNGICVPGVAGCLKVMNNNPTYCLKCQVGTGINQLNNICFQCPLNCLSCPSTTTCNNCTIGFYLTSNASIICAPQCVSPCSTCLYTNPNICTSCIAGYYYNAAANVTCQPSSNCSFSCTVCPVGYTLNNTQQCISCATTCASCLPTSVTVCTSCPVGYWLGSGVCSQCQTGCASCIASTQCLTCSIGFTSNTWTPVIGQAPINSCLPCQFPCITCIFLPNYCLSCAANYSILGNQCVNNNKYQFTLIINSTSANFYQQYPSFVNSIINCFNNGNYSIFFPTSYTPNLVNSTTFAFSAMASSLCSPTTPCATLEYNNLQNLFNSGLVGNLSILSYQLNSTTSNSTVTSCSPPCSTCTQPNGTVCLSCLSGYVLQQNSCLIIACPVLYCQLCTSNNNCIQCMPTFILAGPKLCICQSNYSPSVVNSQNASCVCSASALLANNCTFCQTPNCYSCTKSNVCTFCVTGYSLTSYNSCIACNIPLCTVCYANNFCKTCSQNYSISINGNCVLCQVANCQVCTTTNLCSQCTPGYTPVQYSYLSNVNCIQCFIQYCNNCQQTNNCSSCSQGFSLINNTCQPLLCYPPCTYCASSNGGNNNCITCMSPTFSAYSNFNTCYICQIANCQQCPYSNPNNCTRCFSGYYVIYNPNQTYCSDLNSNGCSNRYGNGTCISCTSGYVLTPIQTCVLCTVRQQGCSTCLATNPSVCGACFDGFYLSNNVCYPCPPYCVFCTSTNCINPNQNNVLINNQLYIKACNWPCVNCATGSINYCLLCAGGFDFQNGNCIPCSPTSNCKSCNSSKSITNCTTCFYYAYISIINNNTICTNCNYPCLSCIGPSISNCSSCVNNYMLINGSCVLQVCDQYCGVCVSAVCVQCMPGFFLYNGNGSCLPGVPGCLGNYVVDPRICQKCSIGTTLNLASGICMQCPLYCTYCSLTQICITCLTGYYLTGNNNVPCAVNCQYPCSTCSYTNASICLSCNAGYIFNSQSANQCEPDVSCSPFCSICPQSYVFYGNQSCVACSPICLSCNILTPNICTLCPAGQYLNNGLCPNCPKGCSTCISNLTCLSCSAGYVNSIITLTYYASDTKICIPCQSPCLICNTVPTYCLSCIVGYILVGTQCLTLYNYQLNMTLSANYSQFYSNYPLFTSQLISPFSATNQIGLGILFPVNLASITGINKATYSVLISSSCLPNTACAENQLGNLNRLLRSNTIAGMTILNYVLTTSQGSPFPSNNTNTTCNSPCLTCNSTTSTCLTCITGFQVVGPYCLNSNCQVLYCKTCSANNVCTLCNPTFILSNNLCICQIGWIPAVTGNPNTTCTCNPTNAVPNPIIISNADNICVACQIMNCLSCAQSNYCLACAQPYVLNAQNLCVICNINNCLSCSSNNFCTACGGGASVSSSGDRCILCSVANCQSCSSSNICSACLSGYTFDAQGVACVSCALPNCLKCQGNNLCSTCAAGYIITTNLNCQLNTCLYPCVTCNTNGTCATCVSPPYVSTPGSSGCYGCNVANCINCNYNNTSVCLGCSPGFVALSNGTSCVPLCTQSSCTVCSSSNSSFCLTCSLSYLLVSGICQPCSVGCSVCTSNSSNSCSSCSQGFYFSNNSCLSCPSYCNQCSSSNVCDQLADNSGQTLVQVNGVTYLAVCDQGCNECSQSNPSICLSCSDGYYLQQNVCLPCTITSNCKTCAQSNPSQCTVCFPNYFLIQSNGINICSSCSSSCLACLSTNPSSCLSCPNGYLLSGTSCLANQCPLFCLTCTSNSTCSQCINGYVTYLGSCVPCPQGCSQCSPTSPGVCLTCISGTYFDSSSQQCLSCTKNCQTCSSNGCSLCFTGYYTTPSLTCAPNCIAPCATCQFNSPSSCLSCQLGYIYNPTAIQNCQPSTGCSATFNCIACPLGFVLNNMQCLACSSNCSRCLATNSSSCTSCSDNQYLNGVTCSACPSGCSNCLSSSTCLTCANGYTDITGAAVNNPVTCVLCNSPCLTCQTSPNTCTACIIGYSIVEGVCISSFNFGFNVKLSANPEQFYQNYIGFLKALAQNVGLNYGAIKVSSITPGSTVLSGNINTNSQPETSTSQTQLQNIQQALTANSNIAGMTILTSNVNTNGGNANPPSPNSNSGGLSSGGIIAIAVIVPLVILVAVGIGIFIYLKKKRANQDLQVEMNTTESPQIHIQMDNKI